MIRFIFTILLGYFWSHAFGWMGRFNPLIWAFVFIFIITTAITGKFYYLKMYGETAQGVVVGPSQQNFQSGEVVPLWVKFKTQDGKEHHSKITASAFYDEGDLLEVYYNKTNPLDSYPNTHWNAWVLFIFGLGLLIIGVVVLRRPVNNSSNSSSNSDSNAVHYDEPIPPPKDGCISNGLKILAIIMLFIGIGTSYKYLYLSWSGEKINARVITAQRPDLSVPYPNTNKMLFAKQENASPIFFHKIKAESYELGDEIEILYSPDSPDYALENNSTNAYGMLIVALFMALYAWGPGLIRKAVYYIRIKYK